MASDNRGIHPGADAVVDGRINGHIAGSLVTVLPVLSVLVPG